MLNATALLAEELGKSLSSVFLRTFGGSKPHVAALLDEAAHLVISGSLQVTRYTTMLSAPRC
jgi:hypothetical protein